MSETRYFINLSNHPSAAWGADQLAAAAQYGTIVDVPFPNIDPTLSTEEVGNLAAEYCEKILAYGTPAVMCQGEFCFSYAIVGMLKAHGCKVMAGCSERNVEEVMENGQLVKKAIFHFVQFREY